MSECSFLPSHSVLSPLPIQTGVVHQTLHKHPTDRLLSGSNSSILDEEKEITSSLHVLFPQIQQLESPVDDQPPAGSIGVSVGGSREEVLPPVYGNSLNVQGTASAAQNVDQHHQQHPPPLSSIFQSHLARFPSSSGQVGFDTGVYTPTIARRSELNERNLGAPEVIVENSSSEPLDLSGSQSETTGPSSSDSTSSSTGGVSPLSNVTTSNFPHSLTTTASNNNNNPQIPSEPSILANKYIILGPVDSSTSHAIYIKNQQPVHVKSVSLRTVREVCSQQSLLESYDGARAPLEAVQSQCGRRAWLVFPPHFGDLHSYVRLRRRLRETEAQRLFAQVAATVGRCHEAGLVLRDLKLRKFVFTHPNRQRVVLESVEDSVIAGESDLLHDKHGCPAYVAPEILSAAAYSGRHADMWGLGVILYTMLVGRYPFHNADTSTLFARIRSGKFLIPEWVSSRARHLILSLLRRQPHRRLTAQQVLLHPWLNRSPRDHVAKEPLLDHIVPSKVSTARVQKSSLKSPPP